MCLRQPSGLGRGKVFLGYSLVKSIKVFLGMFGQEARYKMVNAALKDTKKIRNVSIVAHVDHGKTTLADCLIASNGIIHRKQAGQLRLLDDRLDEQDRGITMKASSIALLHKEHVINLIDSPGHLEFYSEVSAALRLTDAALLVVDTVEGVSSQTFRVLHQLYTEKLPAILVLNKIDKLITQCRMDPMQAFQHLNMLIEQVNAILGSFIAKEVGIIKNTEKSEGEPIDTLESHFYFSTEKKNIVFASSLDNWGFSVESFSGLIAKKLGKQPEVIEKYLWGEYYFNPKNKSFSTEPRNENDRPICVEWLIKPVWDIFDHVENENMEKIDKIITTLGIKVSQGARKAKGHALIRQLLSNWLPLDRLMLDRIVSQLPDPIAAQKFRLPYLLQLNLRQEKIDPAIMHALSVCDHSQNAPLIAFVSKMITFPRKQVNQRGLGYGIEEESVVLGFARIFSGRITRNQEILVIGVKPKKVETETGQIIQVPDISKAKVTGLYFFNGQYPEGINQAYGGCVVGIAGLQSYIFKSGTLSSSQDCISFVPVSSQTKSILKVSVSTPDIKDAAKLLDGLKKLNRSDPSVDVYVQGTGDIILNTCGQVHLEKCVVDLENIYCKVPIKTSDPIITFRETITWTTLKEIKNEKYLQEIEKKRKIEEKKLLKQHYKAQLIADAELDEEEKEKLRAIKEWDSHVEIYESEDLTVEDTRYFLKNRNDKDEYKKDFDYKEEKEVKKLDHKNRGRYHRKGKCLNLNLKTNLVTLPTPNNKLKITVRALSLPFPVAEYLDKQSERMNKLFIVRDSKMQEQTAEEAKIKENLTAQRNDFIKEMLKNMDQQSIEEEVKELILNKMVCFGPTASSGTNFLLCQAVKPGHSFLQKAVNCQLQYEDDSWALEEPVLVLLEEYKTTVKELITSVKNGFWLACSSGPLANEQMMGVIFIIEKIQTIQKPKSEKAEEEVKQNQIEKKTESSQNKDKKQELWAVDNFGPLAGQLISTVKDGCVDSFLGGGPRVVQPMYLCELHTDQQYYGSIHNELSKRRAQIIDQDLHQFSNFLIIKAYLPMLESHNFCFDILDKTQGTVNAQLNLDTWKVIEEDPFYTPLTIEEIEENGLDKNQYNQARIILEKIRQKKGLSGTEKIVVAAEKQRTLKKN